MSRRKGKSEHRISDWHRRYQAGEKELENVASVPEGFSRRAVKLREDRFAGLPEELNRLPTVQGMVTGFFPRGAFVRAGDRRLVCSIAKTFRAPRTSTALTVGDDVTVALAPPRQAAGKIELDPDRAEGFILSRQLRRTVIARPQPRSRKRTDPYRHETYEKVIAANMDCLLIVASTRQPTLRPRLIERYLIVAERGGVRPVIVVNKTDLAPALHPELSEFRELGIDVLACSAVAGEGLEALARALEGRRSVLVGASGVGKSTLVNALVPGADAPTRQVRAKDDRGRHTTAGATVYELPGDGILVDTPGVRELGLRMEARELSWYFPEMESVAAGCRFSKCTHTSEPGCAVVVAAREGRISPRRYQSYLRLLESMEEP